MHWLLPREAFSYSQETFLNLIEKCSRARSGKALHCRIIVSGLVTVVRLSLKLVSCYARCKEVMYARQLLSQISTSNSRHLVLLLRACAKHGYYDHVLTIFAQIQRFGFVPSVFVIPSVIKACVHFSDGKLGRMVHCVALKNEIEGDVFVATSLISMYGKCKKIEMAKKVYDGMAEKDVVTLNSLISGYVQCDSLRVGLAVMEHMSSSGFVKPDLVTWNILISGFSRKGEEHMLEYLLKLMRLDDIKPDVVSWTSIISGFVQNCHTKKAFLAFRKMLSEGVSPSTHMISCLLPTCADIANLRRGQELHGYAVAMGAEGDKFVRSALIDMYAKCGKINEARTLFSEMPFKTLVSCNSMIFGYANHGLCNDAMDLFDWMERAKRVDHLTFTAALTAMSRCDMVEKGRALFLSMQELHKIAPRREHYGCMVNLLGKSGNLEEAYDLIKSMPMKPDVFVWGALLGACRDHGEVELAKIAATRLVELEPGNAGNRMLLKHLYAETGCWTNVVHCKNGAEIEDESFSACSWGNAH